MRAEAYLGLVDDMKSQEAFMTVLNSLGAQAFGEYMRYMGYDPHLVQPVPGDPQVDAIGQRVTHWVGERYKLLVIDENPGLRPPATKQQLESAATGPSIFVSYFWDSSEHKVWVLELATKLKTEGIKVVIDRTHLKLGARTPEFMERSVSECDRVLVICTENYKLRFDARKGGAGYEGNIITGELINEVGENKFIPVLRRGEWKTAVPTALSGVHGVDLRSGSPEEYSRLIDDLRGMSEAGSERLEQIPAKPATQAPESPALGSSRRERGEELYAGLRAISMRLLLTTCRICGSWQGN
jgi:hypothetical protein